MDYLYANVEFLLLTILLVTAAMFDVRFRIIPNWCCGLILLLGIIVNTVGDGMTGLLAASLGVLAALIVFIPQYALGKMGAGDAKLIASAGAYLGPFGTIDAIIMTFVAGGVLALLALAVRQSVVLVPQLLKHYTPTAAPDGRIYLPFGVAISIGVISTFFVTIVEL